MEAPPQGSPVISQSSRPELETSEALAGFPSEDAPLEVAAEPHETDVPPMPAGPDLRLTAPRVLTSHVASAAAATGRRLRAAVGGAGLAVGRWRSAGARGARRARRVMQRGSATSRSAARAWAGVVRAQTDALELGLGLGAGRLQLEASLPVGDWWSALVSRVRAVASHIHLPSARIPRSPRTAGSFLLGAVVGAVLMLILQPSTDTSTAATSGQVVPPRASSPRAPDANARPLDPHPSFDPAPNIVALRAGDAEKVVPDLEEPSLPPVEYRGSLAIDSQPSGAAVFLNGREAGITPLVLNDLAVGSRAVRLVLPGHAAWSRSVDVVADQQTTITAELVKNRP